MSQSDLATFPLPLSDFEYYMLSDNTVEYPMTFVLRTHLLGTLDREAFTTAVDTATKLHPLLRCRLQRNWLGKQRWVQNNDAPDIVWGTQSEPVPVGDQYFDLSRRNGLRISMENLRADEWRATFEFHHSCCDGIGGLNFVGAVLAEYGKLTAKPGEEVPELHPVQESQLRMRGRLSVADKAESCKKARCLRTTVAKIQKMFTRKDNILAEPTGPRAGDHSRSVYLTAELTQKDCAKFRAVAKQNQCSVNDLYLQQMFFALDDWNQRNGQPSESEWIRLGMPVSMRTPCHDGVPACNLVSFVFLSQQSNDLRNENEVLKFIHDKTNQALNNRFGHWFLKGLKAIRFLPGLLPVILKRRQRFATAIVSNVGDLRKSFNARFPQQQGKCIVGNLLLNAMDGVPPVRRGTRLSVSFGTYAGVVTITLKTDPWKFSAEQSQDLLDLYLQRLQSLISEPAQDVDIHRAA